MVMESSRFSGYPAVLRLNPDHTYTIFLRNWDGAISKANSLEDAKNVAKELLLDVLDSLFDAGQIIPPALPAKEGDFTINLPLDASIKIMLRNYMTEKGCKKADLARGVKVPPQRIKSFLSLRKSTSLVFLDSAFALFGKKLSVSI